MTQDDALIIKKKVTYQNALLSTTKKIGECKRGKSIALKLGMCNEAIKYWDDTERQLLAEEKRIIGEITNLQNECNHDMELVGEFNGLFGVEYEYQCKKCGFVEIRDKKE
jgi:hypothetical protein